MQGDGRAVQGAEGRAQAAGQRHLKGGREVRAATSGMTGEVRGRLWVGERAKTKPQVKGVAQEAGR